MAACTDIPPPRGVAGVISQSGEKLFRKLVDKWTGIDS